VIRKSPHAPDVIIMTGDGDPDGAGLAIKSGAWDYIQKPASIKQMMLPLIRALQYPKERESRMPPSVMNRDRIAGKNPGIKHCLELLAQAAASGVTALITGERNAISPRNRLPFWGDSSLPAWRGGVKCNVSVNKPSFPWLISS
jgi:DNA-binding NtrC family response regulator